MDLDYEDIEPEEGFDLGYLTKTFNTTFGDQEWRLNNLYMFQADNGKVRIFKMRDLQRQMYLHRHLRNVVLKARQLGSSTFWALFILDALLFSENPLRCGIIAQTRADAEGLLAKCVFAWENMDENVKSFIGLDAKITKKRISFSNGAFISAGITFRSATCDILLVSELGKMAAKMPTKATEVITGAFPTVQADGMIIVESTAEGTDGYLFDLVSKAQEIQSNPNSILGDDDFLLHFFAWHENPNYRSTTPTELTDEDVRYFDRMRLRGYLFTDQQKWWWARQRSTLKENIYREFPTFEDEAFMATGRALILARPMIQAEENGQVGDLAFNPNEPCVTSWDLGAVSAVWIFQYESPTTLSYIDYIEAEHADFHLWKVVLDERARRFGYQYAAHVLPWDGKSKVGMTATPQFWATEAGFKNVYCNEKQDFENQIRVANMMMPGCFFDADKTLLGRKRILGYRRAYNQANGQFEERPDKNLASHGSEAWINSLFFTPGDMDYEPPEPRSGSGPAMPSEKKKKRLLSRLFGDGDKQKAKKGEAVLRTADGITVGGIGLIRRILS